MSSFKSKDTDKNKTYEILGIEDYRLDKIFKILDNMKVYDKKTKKDLNKFDIGLPFHKYNGKKFYIINADINVIIRKEKLLLSREEPKFLLRKNKNEKKKNILLRQLSSDFEDLGGSEALNYIVQKNKDEIIRIYRLNEKRAKNLNAEYEKLDKIIIQMDKGGKGIVFINNEKNEEISFGIIRNIIVPSIKDMLDSDK